MTVPVRHNDGAAHRRLIATAVNYLLEKFNGLPASSAGDVMVSDGDGSVTWGRTPVKTTIITATDTAWAPTAGVKAIRFTAVGGGGGAGGINGITSADGVSQPGGGGAGCIKTVTVIDATYNITIGAGGAGGAAGENDGANGGDTTIVGSVGPGTNCDMTATGGTFGTGYAGTTGNSFRTSKAGSLATGGDINMTGGGPPAVPVVSGKNAGGGLSGACPIMGGGVAVSINATGSDATQYGEGGGGARSSTSSNYAGGDGFAGIVFIDEYF